MGCSRTNNVAWFGLTGIGVVCCCLIGGCIRTPPGGSDDSTDTLRGEMGLPHDTWQVIGYDSFELTGERDYYIYVTGHGPNNREAISMFEDFLNYKVNKRIELNRMRVFDNPFRFGYKGSFMLQLARRDKVGEPIYGYFVVHEYEGEDKIGVYLGRSDEPYYYDNIELTPESTYELLIIDMAIEAFWDFMDDIFEMHFEDWREPR